MSHLSIVAAILLSIAQGPPSRLLKGHEARVTTLAFSPDGNTLASGDEGGVVRLWDMKFRTESKKWQAHASVTRLMFADSKTLVTAGMTRDKGEVFLWDTGTGEKTEVNSNLKDSVTALAVSQDAKLLAVAGGAKDPNILVYELSQPKLKITYKPEDDVQAGMIPAPPIPRATTKTPPARALLFLSDNRLVAVRSNQLLIDYGTGKMASPERLSFGREATGVSLSLDPQEPQHLESFLVVAAGNGITRFQPSTSTVVLGMDKRPIDKAAFWPGRGSYVICAQGRMFEAESVRGPLVRILGVEGVKDFVLSASLVAIPREANIEIITVF